MGNQLFFNILILCAIMWQGIWALIEENEKLSDVLVRKKRIINDSEDPRGIQDVPYIVNILKNGESFCGASILSQNFLITAAFCVHDDHAAYVILSNSIYRNTGLPHRIERKYIHPNYNSTDLSSNLALLFIAPPIDLVNSRNRQIKLYNRQGRKSPYGKLSGWGCTHLNGIHTVYPSTLRSVNMLMLTSQLCQNIYHNYDRVSNTEICTYDPHGQKRSCHGDVGGPLVVEDELIGVLSWTRVIPNRHTPDVYANLNLALYRQWIYTLMAQITG